VLCDGDLSVADEDIRMDGNVGLELGRLNDGWGVATGQMRCILSMEGI